MMIGGAFRSIYIKFIMFAIAAITIIIFGLNILLPVDAGIDWQAIVFSSFFSVVGVIFFVYGLKVYSKKKLIENIPTSRIRSVAGGLVEIKGKAIVFKEKIKSLLTSKNCVYHKTVIQKYVKSGKSSRWVTIFSKIDKPDFYVKDITGKIVVSAEEGEFDLKPSYSFTTSIFNQLPKKIEKMLDREKIPYKNFFGMHHTLKFEEFTIPVNSEVYVMGKAIPSAYSGGKEEDALMIDKDNENDIFYISNRDERDVTSHLTNMFLFGVVGGGLMVSFGIFFLYSILSF